MKVAVRIYNTSGGGQYDVPPEGDIVIWVKSEGDRVEKGDALCEVEAEKGVLPYIEAPASGTLVDVAYPVGTTWIRAEVAEIIDHVPRYDPPLCWIETEEITAVPARESASAFIVDEPAVVAKKPKPFIPLAIGRLMQEHSISVDDMLLRFPDARSFGQNEINRVLLERYDALLPFEKRELITPVKVEEVIDPDAPVVDVAERGDEIVVNARDISAVPVARRRAAELSIDLAAMRGSGPDGLILACDVEQKSAPQEVPETISAHQPVAGAECESEKPVLLTMPRLWRTIAKNMEMGMRIPTVDARTDSRHFNIRRLTELYGNSRQSFKKIWLPLMVAYARVLGNERFAIFNSYWHEETDSAGTITPYVAARRYVHMGIAYDRGELPVIDWDNKTIRGERLRILTVRNAHLRSLKDITSEVERLFEAAARKRFPLEDVSGYTAIFNNLGVLRHHSGRSILTPGIASMLNLGLVNMESGEAVVQSVVDHRLIDGAKTAPFFIALYKELMQRVFPELEALLLEKK